MLYFHSGGPNNTSPSLDIGGAISEFEIATASLNNLFDDISPQEDEDGLIDYRCLYIKNPYSDLYLTNPTLSINQNVGGSSIEFGIREVNEVQRLTFLGGQPDEDGYIILETEFGPPFVASVDNAADLSTLATNIQNVLQEFPYCSSCTAVFTASTPPTIDISFLGQVGKRKTKLTKIVANRLYSTTGGHFLPANCQGDPTCNQVGSSIIRVINPIPLDESSYPVPGIIYAFNDSTGLYVGLTYTAIDYINKEFTLSAPLTFSLVVTEPESDQEAFNEVYVPPIDDKQFLVKIEKINEGSPINTVANILPQDTIAPSNVSFDVVDISLGTIFALEYLPVWIKRTTTAATSPMANDYFNLITDGVLVSP